MGKEITKLINRALSWDGYLEKKSNRDLDDFTANAGNQKLYMFCTRLQITYRPEPPGAALVCHVCV